jgi:hypothetical protein
MPSRALRRTEVSVARRTSYESRRRSVPPGRARLFASLIATDSGTITKTIWIVEVARCAARAAGEGNEGFSRQLECILHEGFPVLRPETVSGQVPERLAVGAGWTRVIVGVSD